MPSRLQNEIGQMIVSYDLNISCRIFKISAIHLSIFTFHLSPHFRAVQVIHSAIGHEDTKELTHSTFGVSRLYCLLTSLPR